MIEIWELQGEGDRRYSNFAWRTRMALRHKALDAVFHPVLLTDKAAIAFSGGRTVPVLKDGVTIVRDSWAIAEYLEDRYPERPSLFGGDAGRGLARFANAWVDRSVLGAAFPLIAPDALDIQAEADRSYFGEVIRKATGTDADGLRAERPKLADRFARAVDPARATLKRQPFLCGSAAGYADFALFSIYQWARIASPLDLLADDAAMAAWFDRLLDAHDGFGRDTPTFRSPD